MSTQTPAPHPDTRLGNLSALMQQRLEQALRILNQAERAYHLHAITHHELMATQTNYMLALQNRNATAR